MTDTQSDVEANVEIFIDGTPITVSSNSTVLDALTASNVDTPTVCFSDNLTPANACRLCVVELEGSRTLVPSCSRQVTDSMVVSTDSERVQHSRKMVLEFLGSASNLDQAPELLEWMSKYGADPSRYGEAPAEADEGVANRIPARMDETPKVQDNLYIRDYDRCVLCYKCVQACGDEAQHTFAISMSGRGFDSRISTEYDVELPDSACVYCGNCIEVCPTNALQFKTEFDLRQAGKWNPEDQDVTRTVCSYCGVGCNLDLHVQDEQIVKVMSPSDHDVTLGNLCIKGRFGWAYVHSAEANS